MTTNNSPEATPPPQGSGPYQSYQPRLLIAEDQEAIGEQLRAVLAEKLDARVDLVTDGKAALESLSNSYYSVIVTDLKMPGLDGMELIRQIEAQDIPVTVIVTTGHGSISRAVEAMREGAYDFLTKPFDPDRLCLVVARALRERALRDELTYLREQLQGQAAFKHVITKNPKMLSILEMIGQFARSTTTVLIEGETGTGKELIARAIHESSMKYRRGPMVPVNCAALPETLLEGELFGHEKGAFTGAAARRKGRFEQANGGTIFLDEVGEIPLSMQVKLLRVLQERRIERLGAEGATDIDVRVIAATNRSLADMVKEGNFREDLYYRVNVVRIEVPPLRDRPEDIPLLAKHFCEKYALPNEAAKEFSAAAMEMMVNHGWPGNVRELENVVERACVISQGNRIEPTHLPSDMGPRARSKGGIKIDISRPLPEVLQEFIARFESRYIRKALKKARGNVGRCAEISGLSRRSISNKIAEYKINKDQFKDS